MITQEQCIRSGDPDTYICKGCNKPVREIFYSIVMGAIDEKTSTLALHRFKTSDGIKVARHKFLMYHPECFLAMSGEEFKFTE